MVDDNQATDGPELVATDGVEVLLERLHRRRLALIDFMLAEVAGDNDPGAPGQAHVNSLAAVEVVLGRLIQEQNNEQ